MGLRGNEDELADKELVWEYGQAIKLPGTIDDYYHAVYSVDQSGQVWLLPRTLTLKEDQTS